MNSARWLLSPLLLTVLLVAAPPAQSAAPAPLPKDPMALMHLGWQQNGLHGSDLKPWHVRASWQIVDDKGKPEKQGTWEMWWAGPQDSKTEYESPTVHETTWSTPKGTFRQGNGSSGWMASLIQSFILNPLPSGAELAKAKLEEHRVRDHSVQLQCVSARRGSNSEAVEEWRFLAGATPLRVAAGLGMQVSMISIVQFDRRYVPGEIHVYRVGMPAVDVQIDQVDQLSPAAMAQLAPPPDAVLTTPRVTKSTGVSAGRRTSGKMPEYPSIATQQDIQGSVLLWARIGTDGAIQDLEIISGPPALQKSAYDAVKTWHFKPYLLNGRPVEIQTQVYVTYRLRH